jgi:hypothetical protein
MCLAGEAGSQLVGGTAAPKPHLSFRRAATEVQQRNVIETPMTKMHNA